MGGAVPLAQNPPCLSGRWDGSGDRPFRGEVLNKLLTYDTQWDNKNYGNVHTTGVRMMQRCLWCSGVSLLHFLDWKSKPKWLEEVTFRHANGFESRTEPLLYLTSQQALQIARTPRGLQRERPIDTFLAFFWGGGGFPCFFRWGGGVSLFFFLGVKQGRFGISRFPLFRSVWGFQDNQMLGKSARKVSLSHPFLSAPNASKN